jgi:hypothetical protein
MGPWLRVAVAGCVAWTLLIAYQQRSAISLLLRPQPPGAALTRECTAFIENSSSDLAEIDRMVAKCALQNAHHRNVIFEFDQNQGRALGELRTALPAWLWGITGLPILTIVLRWVAGGFVRVRS